MKFNVNFLVKFSIVYHDAFCATSYGFCILQLVRVSGAVKMSKIATNATSNYV